MTLKLLIGLLSSVDSAPAHNSRIIIISFNPGDYSSVDVVVILTSTLHERDLGGLYAHIH